MSAPSQPACGGQAPPDQASLPCVCYCLCAGCAAIRKSWGICDCGLCKAFSNIGVVAQPHICIVSCPCATCALLKKVIKKCDCLTCQLFFYGSM